MSIQDNRPDLKKWEHRQAAQRRARAENYWLLTTLLVGASFLAVRVEILPRFGIPFTGTETDYAMLGLVAFLALVLLRAGWDKIKHGDQPNALVLIERLQPDENMLQEFSRRSAQSAIILILGIFGMFGALGWLIKTRGGFEGWVALLFALGFLATSIIIARCPYCGIINPLAAGIKTLRCGNCGIPLRQEKPARARKIIIAALLGAIFFVPLIVCAILRLLTPP